MPARGSWTYLVYPKMSGLQLGMWQFVHIFVCHCGLPHTLPRSMHVREDETCETE